MGTTTPTLSRVETLLEKMFCKKPTQMHTSRFVDLFVTYRDGFNMKT